MAGLSYYEDVMEISDLEPLVYRGAKLLDQIKPDWFVGLQSHCTHMQDSQNCVLGLIYGDFFTGILMIKPGDMEEAEFVCSYGFDFDEETVVEYDECWHDLTTLWREAIVDRQENGIPA